MTSFEPCPPFFPPSRLPLPCPHAHHTECHSFAAPLRLTTFKRMASLPLLLRFGCYRLFVSQRSSTSLVKPSLMLAKAGSGILLRICTYLHTFSPCTRMTLSPKGAYSPQTRVVDLMELCISHPSGCLTHSRCSKTIEV